VAITVTQLHAHLEAARLAIAGEDYATALNEALAAQTCLAGLPDSEAGGDRIHWRQTTQELIAEIKHRRGSALGIQRTNITKTRVTS
jgi:hypothetical protein